MTKENVANTQQDEAVKSLSDAQVQNLLTTEMNKYERLVSTFTKVCMDGMKKQTDEQNEKLDLTLPLESAMNFFMTILAAMPSDLDVEDTATLDRLNLISSKIDDALQSAGQEINAKGESMRMSEAYVALGHIIIAHLQTQREQNILHRIRGESK